MLERIEDMGVDQIVCLGDVVGYNASPNECADIRASAQSRRFWAIMTRWPAVWKTLGLQSGGAGGGYVDARNAF